MAIARADKLKNVANVAKELLKNPAQTEREIAKKIGVDRSTVNRAKTELHAIAPKDVRLSDLIDGDLAVQELAQAEIMRRLVENPAEISGNDLKGFSEMSLKRSQLLS